MGGQLTSESVRAGDLFEELSACGPDQVDMGPYPKAGSSLRKNKSLEPEGRAPFVDPISAAPATNRTSAIMKIGYAFCSNDAYDENKAILTKAGCDCCLHDRMGHGRQTLLTIRTLLRAGDTLVIRAARQAADTIQDLEMLVHDVVAAKAELSILIGGHTTQSTVQFLELVRAFSSRCPTTDAAEASGPSPEPQAGRGPDRRRGRREPNRPMNEDDVLLRLAGGEAVNAIARDFGVTWNTINTIRKRHQTG